MDQLLEVMQLAHEFGVPRCFEACTQQFKRIDVSAIPWEQVLAFFEMPAAKLYQGGPLSNAYNAFASRLIDPFINFEQAWQDTRLRSMLLQLPVAAVELLFTRGRLKVSCKSCNCAGQARSPILQGTRACCGRLGMP